MSFIVSGLAGMLIGGMLGIAFLILAAIVGTLLYATVRDILDQTRKARQSALGAFDLPPSSRFTPVETPILEG